jgi:glycosyltransferase involved in cell wall biosynthesis
MRILYPYNEILPKRRAHDVYVVRNCAGLSAAGATVTLAFGMGSLSDEELSCHYNVATNANLLWKRLPILRRNLGLPVSMNAIFFWAAQRLIRKNKPDWVVLSVFKQGDFHLKRRLPGVKYVYEVHELAWYPGLDAHEPNLRKRLAAERLMLSQADVITVTTVALQEILRGEPYNLTLPIVVVPLAVDFAPLPAPPPCNGDLQLMYVGQMYPGQGVDLLLRAIAQTEGVKTTLVGGKADELIELRQLARSLGIEHRVQFEGFRPPSELPELVAGAHALVAPFSASGRMPYVAHTKLLEYAAWQRPVLAPDLPATREHFAATGGWVPFVADDVDSLVGAINGLNNSSRRHDLYVSSCSHRVVSWDERSVRYLNLLQDL